MIDVTDEYLHELQGEQHCIESFSVHFIDEKKKFFGFADINFFFNIRKTEFHWVLFYNGDSFSYRNTITFNGKPIKETFSDDKFTYNIQRPLEKINLQLRNEKLVSTLRVSGIHPIYMFPSRKLNNKKSIVRDDGIELWNKYEQRCRITGTISPMQGKDKKNPWKISCYGQRQHLYGNRLYDDIRCHSSLVIQFKDMSMTLDYLEMGTDTFSSGYLSRKSGNVPIKTVGLELFSIRRNFDIVSSEFSYRDASDDVDLLVSRKLHSVKMPLTKPLREKFVRIRIFSEFTIIGTNKKGFGMEDHLVSKDRLKQMD